MPHMALHWNSGGASAVGNDSGSAGFVTCFLDLAETPVGMNQSLLRGLADRISPRLITFVILFREVAERPWLDGWWSMVLGFMRRLSFLPEGSLHSDILRDNIADARQPLMCVDWAAGVDKQFRDLGMGSPFVSSGIGALDSLGFMSRSAKRCGQVWENLHVSPRTAPSKGAKLCTYHHWSGTADWQA